MQVVKLFFLVSFLLVGFLFFAPHQVNAYGNGFLYSRSVTIDHTKVPNTDRADFPVLVSGTYTYLKTTGNSGKVANASGYDVGFYTNSDCSTGKMNWETETYTATSGVVNYWIKVATASHTSDTVFYMCYGNSSITTDQSSATSVWDSNFKGVYHLPNGTSLTVLDSTGINNGTNSGVNATDGKIGGGGTFNGSNSYINVGLLAGLLPTLNSGSITFSTWVRTSYTAAIVNIFGAVNTGVNTLFKVTFNRDKDDNYVAGKTQFALRQQGGNTLNAEISTAIYDVQWHNLVWVATPSTNTMNVYVDGVAVTATKNNANNLTNFADFGFSATLGAVNNRGSVEGFYPSALDDVRISNSARSADWIATEYNNQSSPSTFYTLGSEAADTTAPVFSSVTPASSSSIKNVTSSSAIAFTTDEALASGSITITRTSGTADASSPHTCTLKGTALNVGAHTINLSDTTNGCTSDVSNLVSGTVYTFVLAGQDSTGNVSTSVTSTSVTFDTTSPTAAITYSDGDAIVKSGDTLTITATFSEALLDSPVVKLAISGSNTLSATNMTKTSTTVYTYSHTVGSGNGTATVALSIGTDAAGNVITSAPTSGSTFTVDNTAPSAPGTPDLTSGTDSGSSSTDNITSDTTPDFAISCETGATVTLKEGATTLGSGTCASSTVTITSSVLSETSHTIKALQTDPAGNVSADSSTLSVTIDATAPTISVVTPVTTPISDNTPNYIFTTNETGTISYGGDCSSVTTSASSGSNTITFATLSDAAHSNCTVVVTDAAGNASNTLSVAAFTVDTTAPTITNVSSDKTNGSYTTGEVIDIDVTFSETVTSTGNITVTLETGMTDRTCTFSVSSATTGTCDYTVQSGDTSADLTVSSISGTIADPAGNAMSNFSPATNLAANKAIVIDATGPTVSITAPTDLATVSGNSVSVTADAADTVGVAGVQFKLDGVNLGAEDTSSTYGVTWDTTAVSEGTHSLTAVARDGAGNSTTSSTITVTVDNITIPTLTTSAASGVAETAATLNGSIDSLGGENATARGFEWGHTITYDTTTTESGSHSTGVFIASLSALICNTDYHFRSYATNSAGTGYGGDQSFTTSACPVAPPPPPTPPPAPSGGGGGGYAFLPPTPRAPEGGYTFFISPNPTTSTFVTLNFNGGPDATKIMIADNPTFSPGIYINYTQTAGWALKNELGEQTLYVKFCNQYGVCGNVISNKVTYALPPVSFAKTKTTFLDNLIPDFIKNTPTQVEIKIPAPTVEKDAPASLVGEWELIPDKTINNFVLSPLPADIVSLTKKFPELGRVFSSLGITKMTDLEKLKDATINLPIIANRKDAAAEIVVAAYKQEDLALGSSIVLNSKGAIEQKINTVSGKLITFSVKPESEALSVKGYLLFKRKPEKMAMELPINSLVAGALLARAPLAQISKVDPVIEPELLIQSFEYTDPNTDGIYTADVSAPLVDGEYEVLTVIDYADKKKEPKELRMITVVDPEGYVYKVNAEKEETRIANVSVSIFGISNGKTTLWDAAKYNQDNPQVTDKTGKYSFLVPPSKYYITAEAKGYQPYKSEQFEVKEGPGVHFNIEMTENGSWWKEFVDWKMLIIIIFGIALIINFINDRRRGKIIK